MQTVLITGGTSGIGLSTTRLFLAKGWNVMMASDQEEKGERLYDELEKEVGKERIGFSFTDVSSQASVSHLQQATYDKFQKIDALVNDAGIVVNGKLHEVEEQDWDRVFAVNVKGTYLVSKAFLPQMMAQKSGTIVNISSVSGLAGDYDMVAYNATKGAIINMTRAMAMDYGLYGIRVNSIAPGPTQTPLFPADQIERFGHYSPLGRIVQPEEIAEAVYFAATSASSAMTGETIPITAGFEIKTGQPAK
ncbi:SDR family oxidoreductase [Limosilactobacillus sp. STM2_1]|uniref:SDR family oxidoreductase n=1 Tax=Limosilactobacillus rudii TaxID=2759755 RepID=A0A7W3YN18_9LACO|nr:SDR family oxidoreductase [Limosilactobacillus rudii]MBB1079592.1 SDR family oxidoreductase [Limosilactobacillus rudii]MBB1097638.1 SDR family oxidoreductase [Limosilactobacillus rudii]MCD7134747.1 SDR family oxidoreductase [Limosilactobacillus rudii]